jgi:hypothetical protein
MAAQNDAVRNRRIVPALLLNVPERVEPECVQTRDHEAG